VQVGVEVGSRDFPALFERFETAIGSKLWHKRAKGIRSEIKGNPYLTEWLQRENRIVLALDAFSTFKQQYGTTPRIEIQDTQQYETVSFVTQCSGLLSSLDRTGAKALTGRVRGTINNPADLRALAFECHVATHLQRVNSTLHAPDGGTYDWLVSREGLHFEVECKSISNDKGRPVHLRDALATNHLIKKSLGRVLQRFSEGLLVRVRVPGRFPADHKAQSEIATVVKRAILSGKDMRESIANVSLQHFAAALVPHRAGEWEQKDLRSFLHSEFRIPLDVQAMIIGTPANGALVIADESNEPNDLVGETMKTVKDGAAQMSGMRPGLVCAKFEGLTGDELAEIGSEADGRPSLLRLAVNQQVLNSSSMDHVAWVVFMADGSVAPSAPGVFSRISVSYGFWNPRSEFKDDARLNLFGLRSDRAK